MENETISFWQRQFWGRPVRFFSCLIICSLVVIFVSDAIAYRLQYRPNSSDVTAFRIIAVSYAVFIASLLGAILSVIPATRVLMMWVLRRWFFCAAVAVTLTALFYAEEDWRGKRAWEKSKHELEARGFDPIWENYIPPAVPDGQNFFKAPKMQERFVGREDRNAFSVPSRNENTSTVGAATNSIITEAQARDYIAWSDKLAPDFDLLREALKRPYARMDGDYSQPANVPIPNFVGAREYARVLAQRAHCYFLLHQPDAALQQLTLIHDMCRMFQGAPTGNPMTLVAAMIDVAVIGLYADTIAEGFRLHAWQEPQLTALEKQLVDIKLKSLVEEAFRGERVFSSTTLERSSRSTLSRIMNIGTVKPPDAPPMTFFERIKHGAFLFLNFAPRGWVYQNMAADANIMQNFLTCFDPTSDFVLPSCQKQWSQSLQITFARHSPYTVLVAELIPNFTRAVVVMAHNQNQANMALVACALERYRFAHGNYPDSLDALAPQFIEKLPHDIINGGDLKYRRTGDSFVLYSIGWNEKDDGGTQVRLINGNVRDLENGDWVWPYPSK